MADSKYPLWSTLPPKERRDCIAQAITRASADKSIRDACLGPDCRKAVEDAAEVTFDTGMVIRCLPDQATREKEIILCLPASPIAAAEPIEDYWICTYVDYLPR